MRDYPINDSDWVEIERLNAQTWQIEQLRRNPYYTSWGPGEEGMSEIGTESWSSSEIYADWEEFDGYSLNHYNEVVHFYFGLYRPNEPCEHCKHTGYSPKALEFYNTFFGEDGWKNHLTQDEVNMLWDKKLLSGFDFEEQGGLRYPPSAAEVNRLEAESLIHSSSSQYWLSIYRAQRLGFDGSCSHCDGRGYRYTDDQCHLQLTLWVLHPRKGASHGILVEVIQQQELLQVLAFLRMAAQRNALRFSGVFPDDTNLIAVEDLETKDEELTL